MKSYPLICPRSHDHGWAKTSCWVHASTSKFNLLNQQGNSKSFRVSQSYKLTAARCPAVIESPTANGTDPLTSDRRPSQTPWTTNTRMNVIRASIRTPWPADNWSATAVTPKDPTNSDGVAAWKWKILIN